MKSLKRGNFSLKVNFKIIFLDVLGEFYKEFVERFLFTKQVKAIAFSSMIIVHDLEAFEQWLESEKETVKKFGFEAKKFRMVNYLGPAVYSLRIPSWQYAIPVIPDAKEEIIEKLVSVE